MKPSPDAVLIRPTRSEDVTAYRDLRLEALRNHPEVFGSDYATDVNLPLEHWQERVRINADDPMQIIQVAAAGETLVGMTGIYRLRGPKMQHNGHIWGVYVRPDWRGLGVGDKLIAACIAWARTQHVQIVKLAVVTTNTAAIRCYMRCGFSIYGTEPEVIYYNGVYYDELLMARGV